LSFFQLPAFSISLVGPKGTGAAKACTCIAYAEDKDLVFAGHTDGAISVCNFQQKRQCGAWYGHPGSQVVGLAAVPWMAASHAFCLISQARDGKIRFWDTNQLLLSTSASISKRLFIFHFWKALSSNFV
uniref:WD_REPEATS_REGION domain-containing protein n=1 Tax=Mesocestoides corti TaxID=53468 RepID=A0A5K3ENR3_MESCO